MNHIIEVSRVTLGYGGKIVAPQMDLRFDKPEIVSIIGPNGSGKSTLLKAISRLLLPSVGYVLLDGKDIHRMASQDVARIVAVLPQAVHSPGDMTVYDLVSCGRTPYRHLLDGLTDTDQKCIFDALEATGMLDMANRPLDTLSGGERQRAWLAMALAQQPKILMLDEPTTYLDIHHQLELMKLVQRLHEEMQLTVVMVLHDLNHAARFSHRVIAVKEGGIFMDGPVETVFTPDNLRSLYGVETVVMTVKQGEKTHLLFAYRGGDCFSRRYTGTVGEYALWHGLAGVWRTGFIPGRKRGDAAVGLLFCRLGTGSGAMGIRCR
jgi:iron complex transport system ATP-binding protein